MIQVHERTYLERVDTKNITNFQICKKRFIRSLVVSLRDRPNCSFLCQVVNSLQVGDISRGPGMSISSVFFLAYCIIQNPPRLLDVLSLIYFNLIFKIEPLGNSWKIRQFVFIQKIPVSIFQFVSKFIDSYLAGISDSKAVAIFTQVITKNN